MRMPTCCADLIFSVQPGNDGSMNLKSCQCVQTTEFTITANKGFFYTSGQKIKLCFFPPLSCCSPEYIWYYCFSLLFYHYLDGDPSTRSTYKYFWNFLICWWCGMSLVMDETAGDIPVRDVGLMRGGLMPAVPGVCVCVCIFVHTVLECICACVYTHKFWNRPAFICTYVFKYLYPTNFVCEPHPRHCTCKTTEEACH